MTGSELLQQLTEAVCRTPRYQSIDAGLVERIALQELNKGQKFKETVKAVRSRLHQAAGAYQETAIPYPRLMAGLDSLPHDRRDPQLQAFCRRVLGQHTSTRERLPVLERIFAETLAEIAPLRSVLDLACGLNPLALPWMPLIPGAAYTACDIYTDMAIFNTHFLRHVGQEGEARVCDLLAGPPRQPVHLALLLKAIPCLEQLDKALPGRLLDEVQADYLMISFPSASLGGNGKGMRKNYAARFEQLMQGREWPAQRFDFPGELVFLVKKSAGGAA